jgi:HPt (histidine-containing phosphotransfer) domain-containing protein
VGIFSDDRANELREIFFESSQEILQALNEDALKLEKSPRDTDTVRNLRRSVHTLKGDSAACGYKELSELAHAVEVAAAAPTSPLTRRQPSDCGRSGIGCRVPDTKQRPHLSHAIATKAGPSPDPPLFSLRVAHVSLPLANVGQLTLP